MKILFVTNRVPFPPQDGIEIPLAKYMEFLSKRHEVSLAVVTDHKNLLREKERIKNAPPILKTIGFIYGERLDLFRRTINELMLRQPGFYKHKLISIDSLLRREINSIDVLWISPAELFNAMNFFKRKYISTKVKIILGLNDAIYWTYYERIKSCLIGAEPFNTKTIFRALRLPFLVLHEARYLHKCDGVHIQTLLEKKRLKRIMIGENKAESKIIVARNGIDESLLKIPYNGSDSNRVLLIGHMDSEKGRSVKWFIKKVWPLLLEKNPQAYVRIVGRRSKNKQSYRWPTHHSIEDIGFVLNLSDIFRDVAIVGIPVLKTSGLINSVIESMAAGVPVVGFLETFTAVEGFLDNIHGFVVSDEKEMATKIAYLLSNPEKLLIVSRSARELVKNYRWEDSFSVVEQFLDMIINR